MLSNEDLSPDDDEEALYFTLPDAASLQLRLSSINLKLIAYCESAIGTLDPKNKNDRAWALDALSLLGGVKFDPTIVTEND